METLITIRVVNQDWLDMSKEDRAYFKELKEPEDLLFMKYTKSVAFTFTFEVLNFTVNPKASFNHNGVELGGFTEVRFNGEELSNNVVISNSLLATEFAARKVRGKQYCYFFIRPDVEYFRLSDGLWFDKEAFDQFNKIADSEK